MDLTIVVDMNDLGLNAAFFRQDNAHAWLFLRSYNANKGAPTMFGKPILLNTMKKKTDSTTERSEMR